MGSVQRLRDRLVAATFTATDLDTVVEVIAGSLVELGYAPGRVNLAVLTLHPLLSGIGFAWTRGGGVTRAERRWGFLDSDEHRGSPLHAVMTTGAPLRLRVGVGEGLDCFAILRRFAEAGATDYLALPVRSARGDTHVLTTWTDRCGGWTDGEVEALATIEPTLAVAVDLFEGRRLSCALADSHELLEARIRERTADLETKNQRLAETLDKLQRAQAQLIQTEKMASLGLLIAGIAHEIKNPLNFVSNFAELSLDFADEAAALLREPQGARRDDALAALLPEIVGNLRSIHQHSRRADGIVSAMLVHARDRPDERVPGDLNDLVRVHTILAYQGFRTAHRDFFAELVVDPGAGLEAVPLARQELSRVVLNLVANSCWALRARGQAEGPGFGPTLLVTTRRDGDVAVIKVWDNGVGISHELKQRVFDPFFTTKPPGEGTGLGLSMCFDIVVRRLGGRLELDSSPGSFYEFTIHLPLATDT